LFYFGVKLFPDAQVGCVHTKKYLILLIAKGKKARGENTKITPFHIIN
jgi:hypothetical protein